MNRKSDPKPRRIRTTPAARSAWVRRFERSGLSRREFAVRHRLGLSTLHTWIVQCPDSDLATAPPPLWRELARPGASMHWVLELTRPDGLTLRAAADAPAAWVATLWREAAC